MGNKDINQVVTRDQTEVMEWVERQLIEAFGDCGLNLYETSPEKFKKEMRDKGVQVDKIINGPESGFYVKKNDILIKFIPTNKVDGVLI